jgi:hypothetical protein
MENGSVRSFGRSAHFLERPVGWDREHSNPPFEALRYSITLTLAFVPKGADHDSSGSP